MLKLILWQVLRESRNAPENAELRRLATGELRTQAQRRMCIGGASSRDAFHDIQRDYRLHDAERLDRAFDAMVGQLIKGKTLVVQLAKAGLILEKRAISDVRAALKQFFDRAVEPNDRAARLL